MPVLPNSDNNFYFCEMLKHCLLFLYILISVPAHAQWKEDTLTLFDEARQRKIPVSLSLPSGQKEYKAVVIFSHGYNENRPGSYLDYTYLKQYLTNRGYAVVSIQHELPGDSLLSSTSPVKVARMPNWQRGAANILYVIQHLPDVNPQLRANPCIIMGHSNGGDMSALFATLHPDDCYQLITLDNRRMTLPLSSKVKVATIRSSDQPADEGVLPSDEERRKFGVLVLKAESVIHNHMSDAGNPEERKEMLELLSRILDSSE